MTDVAASIVATMRHPVLVLDQDLRVSLVNGAFCELFQVSADDCTHRPLPELGDGQWNIPELLRMLREVRETREEIADFRVEHDFERIGPRTMLVSARYLEEGLEAGRLLLAIEDVTERERQRWELEAEKELAEKLVDASREGLLILGWDLRVRSANQTFYDIFQVDPAETEGRLVFELGEGQWDIPRLREHLEDVLPENQKFDDLEVEQDFPNIGRKTMLLNARRIDHMELILLAIEDVSERKHSLEGLRASEERLRRLFETEAVGLIFLDETDGTLVDANDAFLQATGYSRQEIENRELSWSAITPDESAELAEEEFQKLRDTGRIGPYEKCIRRDGSRAWMLVAGRSLGDGTAVKFCIDVTDRKIAEEERELLAAELSHRIKNTLAVVQSLVEMMNGEIETIEEFREVLIGRLQALSRAHGLLLDKNWRGVELEELAQQTMAAFKIDSPEMILVGGDEIALSTKQAMGLSLILHELGTNAVKHGALSEHGGRLEIAWRAERAGDDRHVRLTWRERDGPRVEPPARKGFGTKMIEQICSYELDGEAKSDFAPEGLTFELVFQVEDPDSG